MIEGEAERALSVSDPDGNDGDNYPGFDPLGVRDPPELPDVYHRGDEEPSAGEWSWYPDENFNRINVGDVVGYKEYGEDPTIGVVVEWERDEITIETDAGDRYTAPSLDDRGIYTFEYDEETDSRSLDERLSESGIPTTGEEAAELYLENLREQRDEVDSEIVDRWEKAIGTGFEGIDEDSMRRLLDGYEANQENELWQGLVEQTGIDEDVIAVNPDAVKDMFRSRGGGTYRAGTAFVRTHGLARGEDTRPEPGDRVASDTAATTIRHELSHKIWAEEADDSFKEWFDDALPSDDRVREDLTEYAGNGDSEEAFCELIAVTTNPRFNPDRYPDWVSELSEEAQRRLAAD